MESDNFYSKAYNISVFDWLPVSSAVFGSGSDRYPDIYMKPLYARNYFHGGFYETDNFFLKHTEDKVRINYL